MAKVTRKQAAVARDLARLGAKVVGSDVSYRTRMTDVDFAVRMGLLAKAVQTYAAICQLIDVRLAHPGFVLSRSLLETHLILEFLCRKSVRLRRWNNGNLRRETSFGKRLSMGFRTTLYCLNGDYHAAKWLRANPNLGDMQDHDETSRIVADRIAECEQEVGPEWSRRIYSSGSPSGLPLIDTAASLGSSPLELYQVVYRSTSQAVHATDARAFAAYDEDGVLDIQLQHEEGSAVLLDQATTVFWGSLHRFERAFQIEERLTRDLLRIGDRFDSIH